MIEPAADLPRTYRVHLPSTHYFPAERRVNGSACFVQAKGENGMRKVVLLDGYRAGEVGFFHAQHLHPRNT